jgi:hypothetical protein
MRQTYWRTVYLVTRSALRNVIPKPDDGEGLLEVVGVAFTVARVTGLVGWVRLTLLIFSDRFDPYIEFRSQVFLRRERERHRER